MASEVGLDPGADMGDGPAHLRVRAIRLQALAREVRDSIP